MTFISLPRLNELRFTADPVPMPKLWRWCRSNKLPARKIGGEWYVDLDAFDKGPPRPARMSTAVLDRLRRA